jgi:ssRNA-specific RNase YbeY (16S rRNA maturation enzyme)|tara:strand:+ start:646 stop:882 length:237 start_codon:yes stop_codon:yes gene_type:complete
MTNDEFERRYKHHPLGVAFRAFEQTESWRERHIYFITIKTILHLLAYQGELTAEDEAALLETVNRSLDDKLGKQPAAH